MQVEQNSISFLLVIYFFSTCLSFHLFGWREWWKHWCAEWLDFHVYVFVGGGKRCIEFDISSYRKCASMLKLDPIVNENGIRMLITNVNTENMCTRPKCVGRELTREMKCAVVEKWIQIDGNPSFCTLLTFTLKMLKWIHSLVASQTGEFETFFERVLRRMHRKSGYRLFYVLYSAWHLP